MCQPGFSPQHSLWSVAPDNQEWPLSTTRPDARHKHKHNLFRDLGQGVHRRSQVSQMKAPQRGWVGQTPPRSDSLCMCTFSYLFVLAQNFFSINQDISTLQLRLKGTKQKPNLFSTMVPAWTVNSKWRLLKWLPCPWLFHMLCLVGEEQCQHLLFLWDLEWLFNIKSRVESQPGIPHSSSASKVFQIGYGQARIGFLRSRKWINEHYWQY